MDHRPTRKSKQGNSLSGNNEVVPPTNIANIRDYFEFTKDMYCEVDCAGTFRYVNGAWQEILGWSPEQIIGKRYVDFLHPDDVGLSESAFATNRAFRKTFVNRYRNMTGSYQFLEWTGYIDAATGVGYGHAREVTNVYRNRHLLAQIKVIQDRYIHYSHDSGVLFSQILSSVLDITGGTRAFIAETATDPKRSHSKDGFVFLDHVGFQENETGFFKDGLFQPSEPVQKLMVESVRSGKFVICTAFKKDEPFRHYLGVPLYFGSELIGLLAVLDGPEAFLVESVEGLELLIEAVASIVGVFRVSKREQHLQERFRAIADHLPMMLAEFNSSCEFKWTNITFTELTGLSEGFLRGVDATIELFDKSIQKSAREFLLAGTTEWKELKLRSADPGRQLDTIWYSVRLSTGSFVGIGIDISERKAAEAALVQSSKMASLGEMSAGVSHEINNPLTIIQGSAFRGLHNLQPEHFSRAEVESDLHCIIENCDRIARIVRGLRAFSRNAEHEPFTPTPISVIIEDVLDLAKERFRNNNIDLSIDLEFDGLVDCRPIQIAQVLMNLLNNSYDAICGQPDSKVCIHCYEPTETPELVRIEVSDTGPRIPPEIHNRIMDPFFTTKEIGKGTGLGLSISKGIIDSHGGRLFLDSTAPKTTFIIEIPRRQSTPLPSAPR